MENKRENSTDHERLHELCALANSGTLTAEEEVELRVHLEECAECRARYAQYLELARTGIPMLAARFSQEPAEVDWNNSVTRKSLMARFAAAAPVGSCDLPREGMATRLFHSAMRWSGNWANHGSVRRLLVPALSACLVVAIGLAAYLLRSRVDNPVLALPTYDGGRLQLLAAENRSMAELLSAQRTELIHWRDTMQGREQELNELRLELDRLETRLKEINAARGATEEQLRVVSEHRDTLARQLWETEQAYQSVQPELTSAREGRDEALHKVTWLENKIDTLSASNRNYERKVKEYEQLLASDRDIRELMGARNLYIADVFDVDSRSRVRKPFGRVFYTREKSLIFYAFDLNLQPGINNASTFQAWGRKGNSQEKVLNLGIFYMDNASNNRWILRYNHPEQLAEIDSIFITVEPDGRSQKPTGNPFLFALLRKEVNHP